MSFRKELLFPCIVMVHVSFVASQLLDLRTLKENLEDMELSMCDLLRAETDYVQLMFNGNPPIQYTSGGLKPLEGITLPVGNSSEEIQASVCCISDYLDYHLPKIIRNQTRQHRQLIQDLKVFHIQFQAAVETSRLPVEAAHPKHCHAKPTQSHMYKMKVIGLQMLHSSRRWVEGFTNMTISCEIQ